MDSLPCTLLIPAAGDSVRFKNRASIPKGALIFKWNGESRSMIDHIVPRNWNGDVLVGVQYAHAPFFERSLALGQHLVKMQPTTGQAETVRTLAYAAQRHAPTADVLVVNSDNAFTPGVLQNFVEYCRHLELHLGVLVFRPTEGFERYGYVDNHPNLKCGVEKDPVSSYALAGAFYFSAPNIVIRHAGANTRYVSEWFIDMPKPKMSYCIPAHDLHEWGTPELLEADTSVSINWESQETAP